MRLFICLNKNVYLATEFDFFFFFDLFGTIYAYAWIKLDYLGVNNFRLSETIMEINQLNKILFIFVEIGKS